MLQAADLLTDFYAAVDKALGELPPMAELTVPPATAVKILEVTADKLRVELAGAPRSYERSSLPAALAVVIAERGLPGDARSKMMTAVFVAVHPRAGATYRKQAKQWLEESGGEIGDLPLLWAPVDEP